MTGEARTLRLIFGAEVDCTDGHCGRIRLIIVDANARAVTNLAVEPGHWRGGRLVPLELVDKAGDGGTTALLSCRVRVSAGG